MTPELNAVATNPDRRKQVETMQETMNNTEQFNPRELCSRKLWQLVSTQASEEISEAELQEAITELATRRDYLSELERLGKLENP